MTDDVRDFNAELDDYILKFRKETEKALYQECQTIMRKSKKICPIDEGTLRRSGRVYLPKTDQRGDIYVDLSYGTNYAIYVHENMEAYHKPPTRAKFLEEPAREALPNIVRNVVERVDKMMLKK